MKLIVFDDDPTGTQTVHGIPVFTRWDSGCLREALLDPARTVFVLTNSRALDEDGTRELHKTLMANLLAAAAATSVEFEIISRGDSTMRGHFPLETAVIRDALARAGRPVDGELLIPFFEEGGRVTIGDVHFVREGGKLVPAGETEFARDASFGYRSSNLREWIEEKTGGAIASGEVASVALETMRNGTTGDIGAILLGLRDGRPCVINAETYADLERFCAGLREAVADGKRFIYRTAASFVRVYSGISARGPLSREEITGGAAGPGLVVVGSHVNKTTAQLELLLGLETVGGVELSVRDVLERGEEAATEDVLARALAVFDSGKTPVIYTSRELVTAATGGAGAHLELSARVSRALVAVVKKWPRRPAWLLAKGGITSSDTAVHGLDIRRAEVLGPVRPGIPAWRCGPESRFPGMTYIVFPGNVGDAATLRSIVDDIT